MLIGYSGHVVYHVLLPCSEFTVSAIKRSQLCLLVSSRLLFSPNTTAVLFFAIPPRLNVVIKLELQVLATLD